MSAEPTFEEARKELERIVAELESGRANLDQAVALWERGEELYRTCLAKLDSAEGKIEELGRRAEAARPATSEPAEVAEQAESAEAAGPDGA